MRTKERQFNISVLEDGANSWKIVVELKRQAKTVAQINKLDESHFEVNSIDSHAKKVTVATLDEAVNSALMAFNLHFH